MLITDAIRAAFLSSLLCFHPYHLFWKKSHSEKTIVESRSEGGTAGRMLATSWGAQSWGVGALWSSASWALFLIGWEYWEVHFGSTEPTWMNVFWRWGQREKSCVHQLILLLNIEEEFWLSFKWMKNELKAIYIPSVQFSHSVLFNSLQPRGP